MKKSKRFLTFIVIGTVLNLSSAKGYSLSSASKHFSQKPMKFSFSISSGGSYISGQDFNRGMRGLYDYWNQTPSIDVRSSPPNPMHFGFDLGLEFNYRISGHLEIGLGSGLIQVNKQNKMKTIWHYDPEVYNDSFIQKIRIIPVTFNLFYSLLCNNKLNLRVVSGMGYYFGNVKWEYKWIRDDGYSAFQERWDGKSGTWGFKAGINLEYYLNTWLSFVAETHGRYVVLKNLKGNLSRAYKSNVIESQEIENAYLYVYRQPAYNNGNTFPLIDFFPEGEIDLKYSDPQKGKIDLSGLSIRLGIKLRIK